MTSFSPLNDVIAFTLKLLADTFLLQVWFWPRFHADDRGLQSLNEANVGVRSSYCITAAALDAMQRCRALPDGFGHLNALLLPVVRQASDEVQEVQPAAKNAANGAEQHQLTVV